MSDTSIGFHIMVGLNVIQFVFWSFMVQRLVDKLMSRNYYDYQVSNSIPEPKIMSASLPDMPEDMRSINEIAF